MAFPCVNLPLHIALQKGYLAALLGFPRIAMDDIQPRYEHGEWLRAGEEPRLLTGEAAALFRYWGGLARGQGAPTRAQIDPLTHFPRLMPTTMLLGVEREGERLRYRYRVIGSELTARAGRELTGLYLDECFPPERIGPDLDIYRRCIDGQLCYWGSRSSVIEGRDAWETYSRIILPIRDAAGGSVDFLWIYIWFDR